MVPQHWGISCWEALSCVDEGQKVIQYMLLKQSHAYFSEEHCAEHLIQ